MADIGEHPYTPGMRGTERRQIGSHRTTAHEERAPRLTGAVERPHEDVEPLGPG